MANLNIAIQIAAKDNASGPIGKITNSLSGLKDRGLGGLQAAGSLAMTGIVAGAGLAVGAIGVIGTAAFGVSNDVQTATGEIQAALGTTAEESARLADIAKDVWGNNFAGSISEAAAAVGLVRQQMGDLSDNELKDAAENAFRLADNFELDVTESVSAADTLMEQFGLTSDEAFDFIASGMQRGLNRSGDFIDTIGEYSTQFANGGASAGEFFSLMESGLQGGMLGTDKAADAFKEFRVRIQDGSDATAGALEMIGLSSEDLAQQMADGSLTAADAFTLVVDALGEVDDENVRMQEGVALLGPQFEDLGTAGALGLSLVGTEMGDLAGATETLDAKYNNLGSAAEGFKRRGLMALEPIGNVLLGLANNAMPLVDSAFAIFETSIVPAIELGAAALGSMFSRLESGNGLVYALTELFHDLGLEQLGIWFEGAAAQATLFFDQAREAIAPIAELIAGFVSWQDVLAAVGVVVAAVVLPALAGIVAAVAPVIAVGALLIGSIALVRQAWENDWGGIQGKVETAVLFIQNIITTVMTAVQTFWATHGEAIMEAAATAWEFIQTYIDTALSVINSVWQAFKSAFEGDWYGFGANLRAAAETAWEFIKTTFGEAGLALLEWLSGFVLDILAKFNDTDWGEIGTNIILGIANAILGGIDIIKDAAAAAAQAALDAAKGLLGIESPSKVFQYEVGGNIVAGLVRALDLGQRDVASAMTGLVAPPQLGNGAGPRLATTGGNFGGGGGTTVIFQSGAINAAGAAPGVEQLIRKEIERMFASKGRRADVYIRTG